MAQDISSFLFPLGFMHVSLHHPLFRWKLKFYLWNEILVSTIKSHKKRPSSLPAMLKWCWVPCSTQTQNRWMVKTFVCSALLVKREIFSSAQKNSPRWRWIRGIAISLNDANEVVLSIFSALSYPQRQSAIWKCWCSLQFVFHAIESIDNVGFFLGLRLVELLK